MANNKIEERKERNRAINAKVGKRLEECMKMRGLSQADLRHMFKKEFSFEIPRSHLSYILSGQRSLPRDYAEDFADLLSIDIGYLLGSDGFRAENYEEFLGIEEDKKDIKELQQAIDRFNYYLSPNGYSVIGASGDSDTKEYESFSLKHGNDYCWVDAEDMERFVENVSNYISRSIDILILENEAARKLLKSEQSIE